MQLLVTAFAKERPPYLPCSRGLAECGDLRYVDTKNAPEVWRAVGAKFPEQAAYVKGTAAS